MIIKQGNKYYEVSNEMTKSDIAIKKRDIKKRFDEIDDLLEAQIKELREKAKARKAALKEQFDYLNSL